eukprot:TRINITY_DN14099_c0_g1_i1.p1 TRINITY_DN14099_c0_g1~~TRINITY_DN14099_c0_g1_i1.p1  ORF type:complete len:312 (-),score=89.71 TRINITY_DN14099_c0_g1_i1:141-1076(-)
MSHSFKKSSAIVIAPPKPSNEEKRLAALKKLQILDTGDEDIFDGITRSLKKIMDVPIVLVSLVDENRQWFKSCVGLPVRETSRDVAFCAYAILAGNSEPFVIPNALEDERFANNPLVLGPPNIRFYAGAPLVTKEGLALGTLCIIDTKPRTLSQDDYNTLKDCASVVVNAMELRMHSIQLRTIVDSQNFDLNILSEDRLKLLWAVNLFAEGFVMWNANQQVVFVNDAFVQITGYTKDEVTSFVGPEFWIGDETDRNAASTLRRAFASKTKVDLEMQSPKKNGHTYRNRLTIQPMFDNNGTFVNYFATFSAS